jgi:hypothetical protein
MKKINNMKDKEIYLLRNLLLFDHEKSFIKSLILQASLQDVKTIKNLIV